MLKVLKILKRASQNNCLDIVHTARETSTGSKCETSRGPNDVTFSGCPWDVGQTCFLTTHKHIKLTLRFELMVLKFDLRNLS